jgi:branched-chain amino acid transport system permease protein
MSGNERDPVIDETADQPSPADGRLQSLVDPFEGPHTVGNSPKFWAGFAAILLLVLAYPLFTNEYRVLVTTGFFIWIFLALSLSVIWGFTGIFSFGQTSFFGLGGYIFGVVGINLIDVTGGTNLALLAGIFLPAAFAAILGYFMFYGRVSGVYVAIITLATTLILELLFSRTAGQQYTIGEAALGGYNGMTGIPSITLGFGSTAVAFEGVSMYYLVVVVLVVLYLCLRYLVNSDYGHVMVATREDEDRTEMFGYDIRFVKLQVFTLSGAIGGLGGVLYAAQGNFISPPIMGLAFAALPVIWITVGGRATLLGAIIGTFGLRYLDDYLAGVSSEFSTIVMGLILLAVVLFFPLGIIPTVKNSWENSFDIPFLGGDNS